MHLREGVARVTATPLEATAEFLDIQHEVTKCGMATLHEIREMPGSDSDDEDEYLPNMATIWEATQQVDAERRQCGFVKGAVEARDPASGTDIEKIIGEIKERFSKTSLSGVLPKDREPPMKCPFEEAELWLKPDTVPVHIAPYRIPGERKAAWVNLLDKALEAGKIEPGVSAWNTP